MVLLCPGPAGGLAAGLLYSAPLPPFGPVSHAAPPGRLRFLRAGGLPGGGRLRHGGWPAVGAGLPGRLRRAGFQHDPGRDAAGSSRPVCSVPVLPQLCDLQRCSAGRTGPAAHPAGTPAPPSHRGTNGPAVLAGGDGGHLCLLHGGGPGTGAGLSAGRDTGRRRGLLLGPEPGLFVAGLPAGRFCWGGLAYCDTTGCGAGQAV